MPNLFHLSLDQLARESWFEAFPLPQQYGKIFPQLLLVVHIHGFQDEQVFYRENRNLLHPCNPCKQPQLPGMFLEIQDKLNNHLLLLPAYF